MSDRNIKLYELLTKGSNDMIENNLLNEIYNISTYCNTTIGEGSFGRVTIPSVGPYLSVSIGSDHYVLPIVIKKSKYKGSVQFQKILKTLIITSSDNITCEGLILFILSKDWYKGKNLHMPFLLGMGSCRDDSKELTHLILEKCGLPEEILSIDHTKFLGNPRTLEFPNIRTSFLSTVGLLFDYINLNASDDFSCLLPNGNLIIIPDFIDSLLISYLHTSHYVWENHGLILGDQHVDNIFIHWIGNYSRCGKTSLEKLETITYNIGKKFIKIYTNGVILKIGDCGISIMNINKNLMLVGNLNNIKNITNVLEFKKKRNSFWEFVLNFYSCCPVFFSKTIMSKIIDKYNIGIKCIDKIGINLKFTDDVPSELEILNDNLYDRFCVDINSVNYDEVTNFVIG